MSHVIWTILTLVEILCAAGQEGNGPFISPLNSELDIFYTFAPSDTGEFRTLTIGNDKETLLIGAEERVFGQTLDDIRINAFPPIVWATSDKQSCSLIPQSNGGKYCDNVIQVTLPLNDTHIMICGSNSMSPENKFLVRKDVESNFVVQDTSSLVVPLCSYDPLDTVTSLHTRSEDGDSNYFTVMNVMGSRLSLWKLAPGRINIQASERMTGESPEYVKMFFAQDATSSPAMEKVYAVTVETALETGPTRLPKPTIIQIAVQQVADFTGDVHDVLFVGKDNGQILKLVSVKVNDEVKTTELASYEPSTDPVLTMLISQEKELLYVGTKNGVYQLSTRDCSSYTKSCEFCDACSMCVLSQDPGCGWDVSRKQCVSSNEVGATFKQDVRHGNASLLCDPTEKEDVTAEVLGDASTLLGHVVKSQSVTAVWWKYESSSKKRVTEWAMKYRINNDGQLEIMNFDYDTHSLVYEKQDAGDDTVNDDLVEKEVPEIEKTTMPGLTYALGASMLTIVVLVALLLQKSQRNCALHRNSESGQHIPDTPDNTHRPRKHRPNTPRSNRPQPKTSNSKPHRQMSSQSETSRSKQFQSKTHRQKSSRSKTSRSKAHESEATQPMTPEYETPQPEKSQSETSSHSYPINYV